MAEVHVPLSTQVERSPPPRRVAHDGDAGGNIPSDDASSSYQRIVADSDAWQDDRSTTNPDVRSNPHRPTKAHTLLSKSWVARMIGGQDLDGGTYRRAFTDSDRLNIEDDAVEVEEGSRPQRDIETMIAEERRADKGVLAT